MKQGTHLSGRKEYIILLVVRDQEAEAVLVTNHPTLHQVKLISQGITITPIADQLTVPDHGIHTPPQCLDTLFIVNVQVCLQIGAVNGMLCLGNYFKNQLAAGNGLLIARCFAPGVRMRPPLIKV